MRSRIIRTIVASGVVLIGIGLMHLSLAALKDPGFLETRVANLVKQSAICWPAAAVFPHHRLIQGPVRRQQVHSTVWIAAYATVSMAGPKRHRGSGCTHALRTSPVSKC